MSENIPEGKTLLAWQTPEYPEYERGTAWYVIASIIGLALIIYSVFSTNFLFAVIVIILAMIIFLTGYRKAEMREVKIAETGIGFGSDFYLYRNIDRFTIVYEPPEVKNLYLEFKGGFRPRLSIGLEDQSPVQIRELLLSFTREDLENTHEPMSDFWGRILKI